ncbi:hypothetical protein DFH27DRAFT_194845 [Peziza echinospora]|nr:hypothetical protein DFH27DRAFT_194845 [Peziza echinospora]
MPRIETPHDTLHISLFLSGLGTRLPGLRTGARSALKEVQCLVSVHPSWGKCPSCETLSARSRGRFTRLGVFLAFGTDDASSWPSHPPLKTAGPPQQPEQTAADSRTVAPSCSAHTACRARRAAPQTAGSLAGWRPGARLSSTAQQSSTSPCVLFRSAGPWGGRGRAVSACAGVRHRGEQEQATQYASLQAVALLAPQSCPCHHPNNHQVHLGI